MLILSAGELQIRPNGFVRTGLHGRLLEEDGKNPVSTVWSNCKFARTSGGWLFFNLNKRIGNAYTQFGRIANSPERVCPNGFVRTGIFSRLWRDIFQIYANHSNLFSIFVPLLRHAFNNDSLGGCH